MDPNEERLQRIEKRLSHIETRLKLVNVQASIPESITPVELRLKPEPKRPSKILIWIRENLLSLLGALLVLLSLGWFIGYAFTNDWVGNLGQVLIGMVGSLVVYGLGIRILGKRVNLGEVLVSLGCSGWLLSLYKCQSYGIIQPSIESTLMILLLITTVGFACRFHLEGLAIVSILGAMIVPMLVPGNDTTVLYSYLLIVDFAALSMVLLRSWGWPLQVAWLGTVVYSISNSHEVKFRALFYILYSLLFLIPCLYAGFSSNKLWGRRANFILLFSPLVLYIWIFSLPNEHGSLAYALAAIFYLSSGLMFIERRKSTSESITGLQLATSWITGGAGMLFVFLWIHNYFLTDQFIVIVELLSVSIAIAISRYTLKIPTLALSLCLGFIVPVLNAEDRFDLDRILYAPPFTADFWVLMTAVVSFVFSTFVCSDISIKMKQKIERYNIRKNASFFLLVCLEFVTTTLTMALVWNLCHNIFSTANIARGVAYVVYSIVGEALIFLGNIYNKQIRLLGIGILGAVVLCLLGYEMGRMPTFERIVVFLIIGILLIATAIIDKKLITPQEEEK